MLICVNVITSLYSFSLTNPPPPFAPSRCSRLRLPVCDLWHFEQVNATPCCSEELFSGISKGLWQRYDKLENLRVLMCVCVCVCARARACT